VGIYVRGRDLFPAVIRFDGRLLKAHFVDFPECVAQGATPREVESNAERALAAWLARYPEAALSLPVPAPVKGALATDHYIAYIPAPRTPIASAD